MMYVYMTTYDAYENQYSVRLRLASPVASNGVDNTGAHVFWWIRITAAVFCVILIR